MPDKNPPRPSAQSIFDGLLVVGLLALVFLLGCFRQKDADIWWHLKTGQMILDRGELPVKDWFTFTSTDRDWIDLHWLFQITAAKLYSLGGMELLTLMSAAMGAVAVGVLFAARRSGWSWPVTIACWFPVAFLLCGRMYVRPEVVTLVCMSIFLTVLFHANERPRLLWALVPVQILWVNVQGLFILGIVLAGFYWIEGVWLRLWRRPESRLGRRTAILVTLTAVSLFNPYHIRGLLFPLELFRKMSWDADFYSKHISELQSIPQFIAQAGVWQFYILVHLGLCALAIASFLFIWSRRRFDLFRLLTFAAFAWLGLQATRNSGQFALVAGAVTAWNCGECFAARDKKRKAEEGIQRIEDRGSRMRLVAGTLRVPSTVTAHGVCLLPTTSRDPLSSILYPLAARAALALIVMGAAWSVVTGRFYALSGEGRLFGLAEHPLWHAHDAAKFAAQPGMPDRLIAFHLGHAALFEFHKREDQRTFCDPRLEVVSRELLEQYHAIEEAIRTDRPGWIALLGRQNLRMILSDHHAHYGVEATLLNSDDWRCVYFDPVASVFLHRRIVEELGQAGVDFPGLLFDREHSKLDAILKRKGVWRWPETPDPMFHEAESLFVIARNISERADRNVQLSRTLLLLAMKRTRNSEEVGFEGGFRRWRLLGQISYHLAALHAPEAVRNSLDSETWNSVTMLDLARSQNDLQFALWTRKLDFISLNYMYRIAAILGDLQRQLRLGEELLQRGGRTPTEREILKLISAEVEQFRDASEALEVRMNDRLPDEVYDMVSKINESSALGDIDLALEQFHLLQTRVDDLTWNAADRIASLLLRSGNSHMAARIWTIATADESAEAMRLERIADSYLVSRSYDGAIENYRKALELDQTRINSLWGLARALIEVGDASAAFEECEKALSDPQLSPLLRSEFEWMAELARPFAAKAK